MPSSTASLQSLTLVSKCLVFPEHESTIGDLKLSVSDLPMLSCHYIQKGCLFTRPPVQIDSIITLLKRGLSQTLTHFPALAGRLITDADGYIFIACNDAGVDFIHANAAHIFIRDILSPTDVPESIKEFFSFDGTVSYEGHFNPILAVQVTELADGVFIGCAVNHAVIDGTSFWNFFNTFAEMCRGARRISKPPNFHRDSVLISKAVLSLPEGGPKVTFSGDAPLRERIFSFNREAIQKLKAKANKRKWIGYGDGIDAVELMGKQSNDSLKVADGKVTTLLENWLRNSVLGTGTASSNHTIEISSFQSLCALLWRAVTRARKFPSSKTTTFRMAVNCRQRLEPKLDPYYFGNAIQSIPTYAAAGDVLSRDLGWCAEQLTKSVRAHNDATVRQYVEDWESNPQCFPLGNFDGAMITMGSSPRFPMYDNDFGWGRPMAVRSGGANKFDGKISAFPGREGGGDVDLEVVLAPETMAGLESDSEFMQYVSEVSTRNSAVPCLIPKRCKKGPEEERIGKFGEMMIKMLPEDLAFTIFIPSEKAFERNLRLQVNDSLFAEKVNDTYAILTHILGFLTVPRMIYSDTVPFGKEISYDSLSGFRLYISKDLNGMLLVNRVPSNRVDFRKGEIVLHIMNGVIMDAAFEQSVQPD
ncbi:hypothetical protein F0562_026321 [Nyssa sinensis]|uniref:FAS1 domain-containing protein n=1 Tax=Nyssa sinensis TaxID=561372 RepID=A0A5J5BAF0_9ASTE|nr:hypothetical protein F0562_026321 [Nyssa sinensis]